MDERRIKIKKTKHNNGGVYGTKRNQKKTIE